MDRHRSTLAPASLLAALLLLLAACTSNGADEASTDPGAAPLTIVISDFTFHVPEEVPAGATVTVRNEDNVGHTVTADEAGGFDVAVGPGEEVTFTAPDEPGEHPFHCIPHPQMTATLVVG